MSRTKTCPNCGNELPPDAPAGVCPKCLLETGLDSPALEGVDGATLGTGSSAGSDAPTILPAEHDHELSNEPPDIGTKIRYFGDYELLAEIARGGMGVVYKARQVRLNRTVALKMILAGQFASDDDVQRFQIEAEAAAQLDHPGIVPIFEVGEHDGHHFFSMGFVEGDSLSSRVVDAPLPATEAATLVQRIAEAIQYAHENGVIHRDLKPANILLDKDDQPRVTDFGLARRVHGDSDLTRTGQVLGTPSFMPPEQASGSLDEVKETSDVYSLGAILYALLTGRPPFQADNHMDTLLQVLEREPQPVRKLNRSVPKDLETVCLKCLEKDSNLRYHSAKELAEDLGRFRDGLPVSAVPTHPLTRLNKWINRRPAVAAFTAVSLLFVPALASYFIGFVLQMKPLTGNLAYSMIQFSRIVSFVAFGGLCGAAVGCTVGWCVGIARRRPTQTAAKGLIFGGLVCAIAFPFLRPALDRRLPEKSTLTTLTYQVSELRDARDLPRVVQIIEDRLQKAGFARSVGRDKIQVSLFASDPPTVSRWDHVIRARGRLDFKIVAHRQRHGTLIDRAIEAWPEKQVGTDGSFVEYGLWKPVEKTNQLGEMLIMKARDVWPNKDLFYFDEVIPVRFKRVSDEQLAPECLVMADDNGIQYVLVYWSYAGTDINTEHSIVRQDANGNHFVLVVDGSVGVTEEQIKYARTAADEYLKPAVMFQLNSEGAKRMENVTSRHLPNGNIQFQLAVVLDGHLIGAYDIRTIIRHEGRITGGLSQQEVDDLVRILSVKKALPGRLTKIGQRSATDAGGEGL